MKKLNPKKLSLSVETIRELSKSQLMDAIGGWPPVPTATCGPGCVPVPLTWNNCTSVNTNCGGLTIVRGVCGG